MSCLTESTRVRNRITVTGVVQGVGFRPFVYHLAGRLGLSGWVLNHSGGVEIEIEGPPEAVEAFARALREEAPPLARVESLAARAMPPLGEETFVIRPSRHEAGLHQLVSPDVATCPDCLRELLDPADRRYRYPFTNCTNCGPRFTIIDSLPYDRPGTSMRAFPMCPQCQAEYDDPANRRFHAQPNACPVCGPRLTLAPGKASPARGPALPPEGEGDALQRAAQMLRGGGILAIKGLGGFLLACDATDEQAVAALRARKRRPLKPFALMVATLGAARRICQVTPEEEALLATPWAPIVLLARREGVGIAPSVAPGQTTLGVMLPYTPMHHLLLRDVDRPLVMTSGNLSEEPIAAGNDEALERLGPLADAFLLHDRDIVARYDDSVWFVPQGLGPQPMRRARGYAPSPVALPYASRPLLAAGSDMKNTFCLARDRHAFLSQHIGDMESPETLDQYVETLARYQKLFEVRPELLALDLHPDYQSTRMGRALAKAEGLPTVAVQHHHAHIAACLADNGWALENGPVLGVALDGTGYGTDGRIWGGEWLLADYCGFQRLAHLEYLPLAGGDVATGQPWRIAAGYLLADAGDLAAVPEALWPANADPALPALLRVQVARGLNAPLTSSMGRLFDAAAALLGLAYTVSYEGQAAMALEAAATGWQGIAPPLPYTIEEAEGSLVVRVGALLRALVAESGAQPAAALARRFQATIAALVLELCQRLARQTGVRTVALSGGCFQNRLLLLDTVPALQAQGFTVLLHRQVPCNDGGLSLGQAAIAHHSVR
ncbi:MAG: carbamoyltransferase HypF [Anaerolineae bacterium]